MLYSEERKNKICIYVQNNHRASVHELCNEFDVSESTIRRDLKELEDEKLLRRTHGGAISLESVNFEPTVTEKADRFLEEKKAISKQAATLIREGDTILIDSGTTTLELIDEVKHFTSLTVVTNSVSHADLLKESPHIEVIVPGGRLRHETQALVGPLTDRALGLLNFDKAFIGTNGIDLNQGLTTPNLIESATKHKMIQQAKQAILLVDHSKFNKISFAKFGEIKDLNYCITDKVPESYKQAMEQLDVTLQLAKQQEDAE
nr:DeoR/GlpR family DNA-binding transcription regulator [Piscibacillus halophilus]